MKSGNNDQALVHPESKTPFKPDVNKSPQVRIREHEVPDDAGDGAKVFGTADEHSRKKNEFGRLRVSNDSSSAMAYSKSRRDWPSYSGMPSALNDEDPKSNGSNGPWICKMPDSWTLGQRTSSNNGRASELRPKKNIFSSVSILLNPSPDSPEALLKLNSKELGHYQIFRKLRPWSILQYSSSSDERDYISGIQYPASKIIPAFITTIVLLCSTSLGFALADSLYLNQLFTNQGAWSKSKVGLGYMQSVLIVVPVIPFFCVNSFQARETSTTVALFVYAILGITRTFIGITDTTSSHINFVVFFYAFQNWVYTVGVVFLLMLYIRIRIKVTLVPAWILLCFNLPFLIYAIVRSVYAAVWLINNVLSFVIILMMSFLGEKTLRVLYWRLRRSLENSNVMENHLKESTKREPTGSGFTPFELILNDLTQIDQILKDDVSEEARQQAAVKVAEVMSALKDATNLFEVHDVTCSNPYVKNFIDRVRDDDSKGMKRKVTLKRRMKIVSMSSPAYDNSRTSAGLIGNCWSFNCLEFALDTPAVLSFVGWTIIKPLCEDLVIDQTAALTFLHVVENSYREQPYHNATHGAAVCHMAMVLCSMTNVRALMSVLDEVTLLVAALCHDVGHPGRDNKFLVRIKDKLAIRYNDASVLENYHASLAFQIMQRKDCNICESFEDETYRSFRKKVIDLILSTDMKFHFEAISIFRAKRTNDFNIDENEDDMWKLVTMCLKCADIGHAACEWDVHYTWCALVVEEFYAQGDEEASLGLEKSFLCDREKHDTDFCKLQKSFIDLLVKPLFNELAAVEALTKDVTGTCLKNIEDNICRWEEEDGKTKQQSTPGIA